MGVKRVMRDEDFVDGEAFGRRPDSIFVSMIHCPISHITVAFGRWRYCMVCYGMVLVAHHTLCIESRP